MVLSVTLGFMHFAFIEQIYCIISTHKYYMRPSSS